MKFDKNHKVILSTLNEEEAELYITFLLLERFRHSDCILIAGKNKGVYRDKGDKPMRRFFDSAILRHGEDIEEIDLKIKKVRGTFGQAK